MTRRLLAGVVACLALGAVGCGGSSGESGPPAPVIQVTLSADGCEPATISAVPGETRFVVQNPSSSGTNRFELRTGDEIVLSLTNVIGGIARGGTVTLEEGSYEMRCMGGGVDGRGELRVSE